MRPRLLLLAAVWLLSRHSLAWQLTLTPTTTLARETGNNTSAPDSFPGTSNGNQAAGNISKVPVRTLLYPGAATQIYTHVVPWWGKKDHISIGYSSQDPNQVRRQVEDMQSRGIDGVVVDWYGPNSYEDLGTKLFFQEAEARPGFGVIVEIEHGAVSWHSCYPGCSVTTAVIQLTQLVAQTFFPSPAYVRQNGRPILMEFGMEVLPSPVDWNAVQAAVPEVIWIHRNPPGYTRAQSGGGFAWLESKTLDQLTPDYDSSPYLNYYYKIAAGYPLLLTYGSVFKGFNDTLASWSPAGGRYIYQRCGQTWLNSFAILNQWYSASNPLPAMQLNTWNDYEEGSELETGIDNCVSVSGSVSGGVLTWSVSGQENTIHHYTVFISADGENLMPLGDFPPGANTLDLNSFDLPAGAYTIYVKAIGQPLMRNQISGAIAYNVANVPPVAALDLSSALLVAPGTLTASSARSVDTDGRITSTTIDFGDGVAVSGTTVSHTYTAPGRYTVTCTVRDNRGASATTSSAVEVKTAGVFITAPLSGASASSPVRVAAYAVSALNISSMIVYVDNVRVYTAYSSSLDTLLTMSPGTHNIEVKSWDTSGNIQRATTTVVVPNQLPIAKLTLSTTSGIGPLTVSASSAGSYDPDGTITASQIAFGSGAVLSGPTATYTYSAAGTYTVTGTVTDNLGGVGKATATVSVLPGVKLLSPAAGATVGTSVRVRATAMAAAGRRIASMIVYVDDVLTYRIAASSLDTYLSLKPGTRRILVKSWEDTTGVIYQAGVTVTAK